MNLNQLTSKRNLATGLVFSLLLGYSSMSHATVDCKVVEALGNAGSNYIVQQINKQVANTTTKINKRKKLTIKKARDLSFKGCNLNARLDVKLHRKVRRDASGYVKISAKVNSIEHKKICLKDVKVTKVSLSRTLGIGEKVYRWAANRAIKNNQCFTLK